MFVTLPARCSSPSSREAVIIQLESRARSDITVSDQSFENTSNQLGA